MCRIPLCSPCCLVLSHNLLSDLWCLCVLKVRPTPSSWSLDSVKEGAPSFSDSVGKLLGPPVPPRPPYSGKKAGRGEFPDRNGTNFPLRLLTLSPPPPPATTMTFFPPEALLLTVAWLAAAWYHLHTWATFLLTGLKCWYLLANCLICVDFARADIDPKFQSIPGFVSCFFFPPLQALLRNARHYISATVVFFSAINSNCVVLIYRFNRLDLFPSAFWYIALPSSVISRWNFFYSSPLHFLCPHCIKQLSDVETA